MNNQEKKEPTDQFINDALLYLERRQWRAQIQEWSQWQKNTEDVQTIIEEDETPLLKDELTYIERVTVKQQLVDWSSGKKEVEEEEQEVVVVQMKQRSLFRNGWLKVAASLLFLVTAGLIAFWSATKESVFEQYADFGKLKYTQTTMGDNDNIANRSEAYNNYKIENYTRAATLLKVLYDTQKKPEDLPFLGYSLIRSSSDKDQIMAGIEYLNFFQKNNDESQFVKAQIDWYRALGYLKLKDIDSVQDIAKSIPSSPDTYKNQLLKLLEEESEVFEKWNSN